MSKKLKSYRPSGPSRGEGLAEVIRGLADLVETRVRLAFRGYVIAMVALSALFLMIGLNIRGWFISRTPVPVNNPTPINPQPGPRILPDPTIVEPRMDDNNGQMQYRIVVPIEQRQTTAAAASLYDGTRTNGASQMTKPAPEPVVTESRIDSGAARRGVAPTMRATPRGTTQKPVLNADADRRIPPPVNRPAQRPMEEFRTISSSSNGAETSDPVATRPRRLGKKGKEE